MSLLLLLLIEPAWAQVAQQAEPSRRFTWQELLDRELVEGAGTGATAPRESPDHGRVETRTVPSPSLRQPYDVVAELQPPPAALALCPGFVAQPTHLGAFGFQGLGDDNTFNPPDTMGAVGPRHVMTMINSQVRIHNRNGALTYSTVALSAFWAGLSGSFDPKIYYDNLSGRWIAVCLGNAKTASSDWEIIISATNDPTGAWTSYHFDGDAANTRWVDFPCVGLNDKWVAVTFNAFAVPGTTPPPATGPKLVVINKPQLLAGGTVGFIEFDVGFDPDNGFTLQPAVCLEPGVADLHILDSSGWTGDPNGNTNWLRMSHITGTAEAPQWSRMPGSNTIKPGFFRVNNRFSNTLQPGSQNGSATALDAGDARMYNVVYRNGHLWAVHGGGWPADSPDRNAIFWYELQPSLPNPIVQSGFFETGGPGGGYMYPSIAVNCGNDTCIGFSSTSPAIFASACYVTRLAGDPPGTTSATRYFKDGRAKFVKLDSNTPPRNRWGDYSATVVDPLDDKTFWTLQEYAELPSLGSDRFGVQWAQITQGCPTPGITSHPQSQQICLGQPVTFSVGVNDVSVAEYQWNKDGTPIVGATSYNYTIPGVALASAGQYTCTVIGLCAAATSNPATLDVLTAPVVTGFIAWPNATCPGTNASIIPALPDSGSDPVTITLQKYDGASWQDVPNRTISPGNAFDFTPLVRADTGDYRLRYGNACGSAYTSQHRLQVGVSFDQQPAPQSKLPCETATFSVVARGLGSLSYQWRKGGVPLADDGHNTGVNTATLSIVGVGYEDENSYDCVVTDSCGPLASSGGSLTIPLTPIWARRVTDQPVKRSMTAMAYDSNRRVTVLFGGYGPNAPVNDTWEWDGTNWTQPTLPLTPGRRYGHAITYDSDRKVILLYGGYLYEIPGGWQSDLWEFDGQSWTQRAPSNAPGGPSSYAASTCPIAYDSARRRIVMVRTTVPGGTSNTETWEFDQATATWSLRVASNNFPGGYGDVLGFDPIRNLSVHYYASASYDGYKASYRWNGSTWTPDPPAAANMAWTNIAYDTTRRRLVIFGGTPGSNAYQTDSFFDTGSGWAVLLPPGPPSSPPVFTSQPIAMAYDSHRRAMVSVLWPYYGAYEAPMETWEYRYLDRVVFDRQPVSQPLNPGGSTSFSVVAAGYGTLSYQWRRKGVNLADGPAPGGGTISGATTAALTINPVGAADAGAYTCVVSNACGGVTSNAAALGTPVLSDFDEDGDVDLVDFLHFSACFNGPNRPPAQSGCGNVDFDRDSDVDLVDFLPFSACFNGPNNPPACSGA